MIPLLRDEIDVAGERQNQPSPSGIQIQPKSSHNPTIASTWQRDCN
jgi:hypothetical protein